MKTIPFWIDDFPRPADLPVGPLPDETDVLVVGAGYTGLAAARELARSGRAVTVVDRGEVGAGASSLNGGQVNYGLKAATTTVFERYGPVLGRQLWDASLEAIELVEQISTDEGIDADFSRPGAAELGFRHEAYPHLAKEAQWMRHHLGFETELVPLDRMRDVIDSDAFSVALLDRVGAAVHPAKYVFGLATAAARRGVVLVEHAAVVGLDRNRSGFTATTTRGAICAGQVVMATNGYTPVGLVPEFRRSIVPVGSYMIATEPLDPEVAERLIPGNRIQWTSNRLVSYLRRSPDDRILLGGRRNLTPGLDLDESARDLGRTLGRYFPELRDATVTHSWGGRLGVTFDLLPHIGRFDGVWCAAGYGGHGVGLGTYLGTEVARLINGEADTSPFARIPFPQRPYYRKQPWFLPAAVRWYRLLDRLGL